MFNRKLNTKTTDGSSYSYQQANLDPELRRSLSETNVDSQTKTQESRQFVEDMTTRYYLQLTAGCNITPCNFRLCASCPHARKLTHDMASMVSVQLASRPSSMLCPNIKKLSPAELAIAIARASNIIPSDSKPPQKQFLSSLLSFSSFSHIFDNQGTASDNESSNADNGPHEFTSLFDVPAKPMVSTGSKKVSITNDKYVAASSSSFISHISLPNKPHNNDSLYRKMLNGYGNQMESSSSTDSLNSLYKDTKPDNVYLQYITYSLFQRAVATYDPSVMNDFSNHENGLLSEMDPSFLLDTISTVFSSRRCLSNSFLSTDLVPKHPSKLDINSINEFYILLMKLKPSNLFINQLMNSFEILLSKMLLNMKVFQNGGDKLLYPFIIILQNPLLQNSREYDETILRKLCQAMGSLRSRQTDILINWFSTYDPKEFLNIVIIFKSFLTNYFFAGPIFDNCVISCVKILSLLCHANNKGISSKISISEFYLPILAEKLNFKSELRTWKQCQDGLKFSFFSYPFLFDSISKARIMRLDALDQMSKEFENAYVSQALIIHAQKFLENSDSLRSLELKMKQVANPFLVLEIRRAYFIHDIIDQISKKSLDLKKPVKIKFIGGGEEGMDQGGVQKEFFQTALTHLLDPKYGLFIYDEDTRDCWINGFSVDSEVYFELVGTLMGLAMYNGVMLGISFTPILYKKLLNEKISFVDFKESFPALGKGLNQLLEWETDDVEDIFMRSFEITYEQYGLKTTVELIENGTNTFVNNSNREEFVNLYINHYVNISIIKQFTQFQKGFMSVCDGKVLKMCHSSELQLLICGNTSSNLDFKELEEVAEYDDGYSYSHPIIKWFWEIVHSFDLSLKRKLLIFVTASDRIPLNGLKSLTFLIQRNGPDSDRLPTALTCFGRLLLPEYSSLDKMKERITVAIENAQGFGLV